MMTFSIRTLAIAATMVVMVSCKKKDETTTTGDGDTLTANVPSTTQPGPLTVASVDLGKAIDADKKVVMPMTTFAPRDTIYASVATTGTGTGATLTAKWTFDNKQTVDSSMVTISPTGPTQTEFHVMKASGWPVGKYKVVILLDGRQVSEKEFEVKKG